MINIKPYMRKMNVMAKRSVVVMMAMIVWVGLVRAEDAKEVIIGNARELKGIKAKKITWKKDRAKMVLIPAGSFGMGTNDGSDNEKPVHTVCVNAFYMDEYEVTNGQYRQFVRATGHREPGYWDDSDCNQPNQPVVGVSWDDAVAYARWAGKRLPTEAEWEYAARGGLSGKKYPWGDSISSSQANYGRNVGNPVPVGSYSANGYDLYDMAGNVWEWCSDWYGGDYYSNSPSCNPQGPSSGSYRVLRGGSLDYHSDPPYGLRVAYRNYYSPSTSNLFLGFRCVPGFPAVQQ